MSKSDSLTSIGAPVRGDRIISTTPTGVSISVVELDPTDPFERAVIDIVKMNRKKRADYALSTDIFSNFRDTAKFIGKPTYMAALFNCRQKLARVESLTVEGKDPVNEALEDTLLDNAVYGVISYAIYKSDSPIESVSRF